MTGALLLSAAFLAAAGPIDEPAPEDFAAFLEDCYAAFRKENDKATEKLGLKDYDYDYDLGAGVITFKGKKPGLKSLVGEVQLVGMFREDQKTWVWAWAIQNLEDKPSVADSLKLKDYGEKNHLDQFTKGRSPSDAKFGTRMLALDAKLLGADWAFVNTDEQGRHTYLLVRGIKPAE